MTQLRNAVLFALAFDATPEEIDNCIDNINAFYNRQGIDPAQIAAHAGPGSTPLQLSAPPAATGILDKNGLPWDERIHASTKAFNADGTWRGKRGADAALVAQVTAELKAAVGAPATPAAASTPPALPLPAALPLPTSAPALPLPDANPQYTALVQLLVANTKSDTNPTGRITDDWVKGVLTHYQVPGASLQNLAHSPALIETVGGYIKQALGIA